MQIYIGKYVELYSEVRFSCENKTEKYETFD
jgi:hypothetical protein